MYITEKTYLYTAYVVGTLIIFDNQCKQKLGTYTFYGLR